MNSLIDLGNKRYPCEYCGGRGFVVSGENDSYCCPRCNGDCDDPVFEQGRICGRRAGIEEAIKLCSAKKQAYKEQQDKCSHWAIADLESDLLEAMAE